ncbi:hypothetical protein KM043_013244 [Ampulex compressa]|nr:hypothetical protein KM043_013244 [Ampulex compressa]
MGLPWERTTGQKTRRRSRIPVAPSLVPGSRLPEPRTNAEPLHLACPNPDNDPTSLLPRATTTPDTRKRRRRSTKGGPPNNTIASTFPMLSTRNVACRHSRYSQETCPNDGTNAGYAQTGSSYGFASELAGDSSLRSNTVYPMHPVKG